MVGLVKTSICVLIITSLESGAAPDSLVQIDLGKSLNADLFPFSEAICELFGPETAALS